MHADHGSSATCTRGSSTIASIQVVISSARSANSGSSSPPVLGLLDDSGRTVGERRVVPVSVPVGQRADERGVELGRRRGAQAQAAVPPRACERQGVLRELVVRVVRPVHEPAPATHARVRSSFARVARLHVDLVEVGPERAGGGSLDRRDRSAGAARSRPGRSPRRGRWRRVRPPGRCGAARGGSLLRRPAPVPVVSRRVPSNLAAAGSRCPRFAGLVRSRRGLSEGRRAAARVNAWATRARARPCRREPRLL